MSAKLILVLGATGAQGIAVIDALLSSSADGSPSPYSVRALTRDPENRRAKELAAKGVEVVQGDTNDLSSIAAALDGAYGIWVNTDGFTIGEQREIFSGMRIFELAKQTGTLRHYIWGSLDYWFKIGGYEPQYRTNHCDAKGRVAEWMQMQPSVVSDSGLSWSIVTTGMYMEMLRTGMLGPLNWRADGTAVFASPLGDGKAPLIALADIGFFARYCFGRRAETSGAHLAVVSEMVRWDDLVATFTKVTGQKAVYKRQPVEEWLGDFADAEKPVAAMGGAGSTSWGQNFSGMWSSWRDGHVVRDEKWIRAVNPAGYTLEKWMRENEYDGRLREDVLKMTESKAGISTDVEVTRGL